MRLNQVLQEQTEKLAKYKMKSPHLEAEILFSFVLQKSREYLLAHSNEEIKQGDLKKYEKIINKRIKGMPIAYLVGKKSFYGLEFLVNKNVLIPRPETELIVDHILSGRIKNLNKALFVDIGTGSGCIIITLAKKLTGLKKNKKLIGIDISGSALRIAKKNAKLHKVNTQIKFIRGDLLSPILDNSKIYKRSEKIIITANLPYLTPKQTKNEPSIKYEPKIALKAGRDGLKYYRQLFKDVEELQEDFNKPIYIFCEINPEQTIEMKKIIRKILPEAQIKTKKDLAGLNRLVIVKI